MPVNLSSPTVITTTGDSPSEQQAYFDNLRLYNPGVYAQIKHLDPKAGQAEAQAAADAAAAANAGAVANSAASNQPYTPPPPPPYAGPSALQKLEGLLPPGFDQSRLPGTFDDPFIEQQVGRARGSAEGLIANMLRRGTITDTGQASGLSALTSQEPGVRQKLSGIGDLLLENERGSLRGIANQGRQATAGQTGEFFDPSPYGSMVDTELGRFTGAFPGQFSEAAGGVGFDTSGLSAATGAAAGGGRGEPFDPYAVAGGKIGGATGLDERQPPTSKKRSTAVF